MVKPLLALIAICTFSPALAQDRKAPAPVQKQSLPDVRQYITATQENTRLYTQNLGSHSQEHDVNSIIKDIEVYLNDMPKTRSAADAALIKEFNPLRHFFLTTTNKTAVSSSFLYTVNPYQFCSYADTATLLYIFALKDGNTYSLDKMTEKRVIRTVLDQCMLPALKAVDEFTGSEVKYIALSVYYGCKDSRQGAPKEPVAPYCLTLVARLTDLQQFGSGLITEKGLLNNAELYYCDGEHTGTLSKVTLSID